MPPLFTFPGSAGSAVHYANQRSRHDGFIALMSPQYAFIDSMGNKFPCGVESNCWQRQEPTPGFEPGTY